MLIVTQLAKNELVRIWKCNIAVSKKQRKVNNPSTGPEGSKKRKLTEFQTFSTRKCKVVSLRHQSP
jgi:hypothetical protein